MAGTKLTDADLAAIRAASARYVSTALARDWDKWMEVSQEDAVFLPPDMEALDTRAKIRAFLENFPVMSAFTVTPVEIDGRDDLAFARGRYDFTAGGVRNRGKYVEVWRHQPDGSWKIFRDIWNSDSSGQ